MKDYFHLFLKFISYNRGVVASLLIVGLVGGCAFFPPKAPSPSDPKVFVNEYQLEAEKIAFNARYMASKSMIEAQKTLLNNLAQIAVDAAGSIPTPWSGLLATALGTVAAGAGYDNFRKGRKIKQARAPG